MSRPRLLICASPGNSARQIGPTNSVEVRKPMSFAIEYSPTWVAPSNRPIAKLSIRSLIRETQESIQLQNENATI